MQWLYVVFIFIQRYTRLTDSKWTGKKERNKERKKERKKEKKERERKREREKERERAGLQMSGMNIFMSLAN